MSARLPLCLILPLPSSPCRARTCPYCRRSRYAPTSPSRFHKHYHCNQLRPFTSLPSSPSCLSIHSLVLRIMFQSPRQSHHVGSFLVLKDRACMVIFITLLFASDVAAHPQTGWQPTAQLFGAVWGSVCLIQWHLSAVVVVVMEGKNSIYLPSLIRYPQLLYRSKLVIFHSQVSFSNKALNQQSSFLFSFWLWILNLVFHADTMQMMHSDGYLECRT